MSDRSVILPQRRRGSALEKAIFAAAWEELRAVGYQRITFDSIAAHAGTSKAVLYRRWPNRFALVKTMLDARWPLLLETIPDTGSLRSDVITMLEHMNNGLGEFRPDIVWGMLADTESNDEAHEQLRQQIKQHNITVMMLVLTRAEQRTEIATSAIAERIITLPFDLARHEILLTGKPATRAAIVQIVDDVFLPLLLPTESAQHTL
jgi:AcrR family transcriptional regulator